MTPHPTASRPARWSPPRAVRAALLLGLAMSLSLATSGCTIEVVDSRGETTPATSAAPEPDAGSDDGSDDASTAGTGATPQPDDDASDSTSDAAPDSKPDTTPRSGAIPDDADDPDADPQDPAAPRTPTTTLTCTDGALVIWNAGQAAALAEDCAHVTIAAADVDLTAGAITTLEIAAAGAVVHARSIETLLVAGADNTVVWTEGSPSIDDAGAGNVLVQEVP